MFVRFVFVAVFLTAFAGQAQVTGSSNSALIGETVFQMPVRFEFNKPNLDSTSYRYLDSVVQFMREHPEVILEVRNHLDTRSDNQYSSNLSQRRAEAIVNYLKLHGIYGERLVPKGYGDTQPLISDAEIAKLTNKEEIELAHQKNRRTEFVVLSTEFKIVRTQLDYTTTWGWGKILTGTWQLRSIQFMQNGQRITRTDTSQTGGQELTPPIPDLQIKFDTLNYSLSTFKEEAERTPILETGTIRLFEATRIGAIDLWIYFYTTGSNPSSYLTEARLEFVNVYTFRLVYENNDAWYFHRVHALKE